RGNDQAAGVVDHGGAGIDPDRSGGRVDRAVVDQRQVFTTRAADGAAAVDQIVLIGERAVAGAADENMVRQIEPAGAVTAEAGLTLDKDESGGANGGRIDQPVVVDLAHQREGSGGDHHYAVDRDRIGLVFFAARAGLRAVEHGRPDGHVVDLDVG